jgi:hypothetical protein
MIARVWLGKMGASKADASRFAAMKAIATLGNQVGGPTVPRS